jgi:hypothetical protein
MLEQLGFVAFRESMSFAAGPHAKTSAALASKRACRANARVCYSSTSGSSVSCAPGCASRRTCTPVNGGHGWTRFGAASRAPATRSALEDFSRLTSARRTGELASSWWPTPVAQSYGSNRGGSAGRVGPARHSLEGAVKLWPTPTAGDSKASGAAGYSTESGRHSGTTLTDATARAAGATGVLNPDWVETLQGFPVGWTSLPDGPQVATKSSTLGSRREPSKTRKRTGGSGASG